MRIRSHYGLDYLREMSEYEEKSIRAICAADIYDDYYRQVTANGFHYMRIHFVFISLYMLGSHMDKNGVFCESYSARIRFTIC